MRLKKDEQVCIRCDGTGMLPDGAEAWRVKLCDGCNGHGVVVYDKYLRRVVAFDVEARTATKIARIGGEHE